MCRRKQHLAEIVTAAEQFPFVVSFQRVTFPKDGARSVNQNNLYRAQKLRSRKVDSSLNNRVNIDLIMVGTHGIGRHVRRL